MAVLIFASTYYGDVLAEPAGLSLMHHGSG